MLARCLSDRPFLSLAAAAALWLVNPFALIAALALALAIIAKLLPDSLQDPRSRAFVTVALALVIITLMASPADAQLGGGIGDPNLTGVEAPIKQVINSIARIVRNVAFPIALIAITILGFLAFSGRFPVKVALGIGGGLITIALASAIVTAITGQSS